MTPASRVAAFVVTALASATHGARAEPPGTPLAATSALLPDASVPADGAQVEALPSRSGRAVYGDAGAVRFTLWPGSYSTDDGMNLLDVWIANEGEEDFTLGRDDTWTIRLGDGTEVATKRGFRERGTRRRQRRVAPHEIFAIELETKEPLTGAVRSLVLNSAPLGRAIEIGLPFSLPSPRLTVPPIPPTSADGILSAGQVPLAVLVDAHGVPARVDVLRDEDSLLPPTAAETQAAVAAVSRWRFTPAVEDGLPCAALVFQRVEFSVQSVVATVPLPLNQARERVVNLIRAAFPKVVTLPSVDGLIAIGPPQGPAGARSVRVFEVRLGADEEGGPTWIAVGAGEHGVLEGAKNCRCSASLLDPTAPEAFVRWLGDGLALSGIAWERYAPQEGTMVPSGRLEPPALGRWNWEAFFELVRTAVEPPVEDPGGSAAPAVTEADFLRDTDSPTDPFGSMSKPRLLHRVEPDYPEAAQRARIQGRVYLSAVIDHEGGIDDLRVLAAASPDLARASVAAVCCWKYAPALRDGKPVAIQFTITVEFKLR